LQTFGSIVAEGASVVFGPSAQCWNAISFVISATQRYSDVLDAFVTLMERCLAFLVRLNLFLGQQPSKRERFKLVLNIVFFSGDADVKDSLEMLERLV
ncbi:hypothetical protein K505DRAFT_188259, partial [Melanomma pulvis-pyrius CBS 109.77]